jgi:hypothetical protein
MSNFSTGVPDAYVLLNGIVPTYSSDLSSSCYSCARTAVVAGSLHPVWDEEILLPISGSGFLVFNVYSRSIMAEDIFLGQATIDISEHRNVYDGKSVSLTKQLLIATRDVYDIEGNKITVPDIDESNKSTIQVKVSVPDNLRNMCGWFFEVKSNLFNILRKEKVYIVLYEGTLTCYESPQRVAVLKKIDCQQIKSVSHLRNDRLDADDYPVLEIVLTNEEALMFVYGSDSKNACGLWKHSLSQLLLKDKKFGQTKQYVSKYAGSYLETKKKRNGPQNAVKTGVSATFSATNMQPVGVSITEEKSDMPPITPAKKKQDTTQNAINRIFPDDLLAQKTKSDETNSSEEKSSVVDKNIIEVAPTSVKRASLSSLFSTITKEAEAIPFEEILQESVKQTSDSSEKQNISTSVVEPLQEGESKSSDDKLFSFEEQNLNFVKNRAPATLESSEGSLMTSTAFDIIESIKSKDLKIRKISEVYIFDVMSI